MYENYSTVYKMKILNIIKKIPVLEILALIIFLFNFSDMNWVDFFCGAGICAVIFGRIIQYYLK